MHKCSSTFLYHRSLSDRTSTRVLKLFRTFTEKMTSRLSLFLVFNLLFEETVLFSFGLVHAFSVLSLLSVGIAYIEQGENHGRHYDSRWG